MALLLTYYTQTSWKVLNLLLEKLNFGEIHCIQSILEEEKNISHKYYKSLFQNQI